MATPYKQSPSTQSVRKRHDRRFQTLKEMRNPQEADWQMLSDYMAPKRLRLVQSQKETKGATRSKIVNSHGSFALRTLASGMHSGITSPARPWFRLGTLDPALKEFGPVKTYLADVETRMRQTFQSSNIYNAFHIGYGDLGLFGQSCGILVEDKDKIIRMIQLLHGTFWLARNYCGIADTLYRQFYWSCERIVARFGYAKCSLPVQQCYDRGDYDEKFLINHAIEPRHQREVGKIDKKNKPFTSNYWEDAAKGDGMLEESGFDENPIIAPPWELVGEDHYSEGPGIIALPDVKGLQVMVTRKAEAVDKKVRPPMVAPVSLKGNPASLLPGSVTFVDDATGKNYRAAIDVNINLADVREDINETKEQISQALFADLFLMLANMEGIQPRNQFEIAERKEEKLLALGPVLENIYGGQLQPTIDRAYSLMHAAGKFPPAPDELKGQDLKIEYISMLAQAQKAVATGGIERLFSFAGNLAAVNPAVLDKIDMDEGVDQYAEMIGSPPSVIVSDDKVQDIRKNRAAAQAKSDAAANAATMAPAAQQGAQAAALLAQTDAGNPNSLLAKLGIAG